MANLTISQREQMRERLSRDLSESGISIRKKLRDDCLLLDTPDGDVYLFYHTSSLNVEDLKRTERDAMRMGTVSNVFYKDGKTFFVPLTEAQVHRKFRRSFGDLNYQDAKSMISLREKEKYALAIQASNRDLAYYQPDTTANGGRLSEGLVLFNMEIPQKNYNHVPENRPGYHHIMEQHGTDFVDFARSANRRRLEGQLIFRSVANNRHVAVLSSLPRVSSQSIQDISLRSFLEETGTTLDDWGGDVSEYIDPQ